MFIPIVYASTSGNVEATMEFIAQKLNIAGHTTELFRVEKSDISVFEKSSTFIFATSTWDHGTLNPYWDKMLEKMKLSSKFKQKIQN